MNKIMNTFINFTLDNRPIIAFVLVVGLVLVSVGLAGITHARRPHITEK